jgi:aminotransferase
MALLEETKVASVPGTAFYQGAAGEKLLRFCFAKDEMVLHEAAGRLRAMRGAAASAKRTAPVTAG